MRHRIVVLIGLSFLTAVFLSAGIVSAEDSLKEILGKQYRERRDICPVVKYHIKAGMVAREVTKTSIQICNDACRVVECAIEAHGPVENVIEGAVDAGANEAVVSRCALNAGAEAKEIGKALDASLGYSSLRSGMTAADGEILDICVTISPYTWCVSM